jgi:hypothetical protein
MECCSGRGNCFIQECGEIGSTEGDCVPRELSAGLEENLILLKQVNDEITLSVPDQFMFELEVE